MHIILGSVVVIKGMLRNSSFIIVLKKVTYLARRQMHVAVRVYVIRILEKFVSEWMRVILSYVEKFYI